MLRRDFLTASGFGVGGFVLPSTFGKLIAAEALMDGAIAITVKKTLADAALAAATAAGASYCDVRVGRYLRQFVITRDAHVENVVNTESIGV
ncbi:MAG: TldD/PmbA family protein, partial [Janthinobacterium lividum]